MTEPEVTHRYTIFYDEETETSEVQLVDSYDDEPTTDDYMGLRILNNNQNLGDVKLKDKIKLTFPFEGDRNQIEKIKPSCGCTAEVQLSNKEITAMFTPDAEGPFTKGINVYLKDGVDLTIVNNLGVEVFNPKKKSIKLVFTGKAIK